MNRELIYAGIFAKLNELTGFKTKSRLLKHWADTPKTNQPALFMSQGKETYTTVRGQPTKIDIRFSIYLYVSTDGNTPPGTVLNPLLDAITNLITTRNINGVNDLGGGIPGVEYARIDGTIETDEGTLGNQAVAIIPVLILVTD